MYIDTHAHLTFPEFESDLPAVVERAQKERLEAVINIALDDESLNRSLKLAGKYPGYIFIAAGIHPQDASQWNDGSDAYFKALAEKKSIVALGETGLDYHYKLSPEEQQQLIFRKFLQLGQEYDLPVIIHSREASRDTLTILREENRGNLRGVLHCFAGDMDLGQGALEMGFSISFTGNITFPKADKLREAVKSIPLDRIMIETDCPFLAPQQYRGQRNEPSYVVKVAEKIAELKGLKTEEVAITTTENARRLFSLT